MNALSLITHDTLRNVRNCASEEGEKIRKGSRRSFLNSTNNDYLYHPQQHTVVRDEDNMGKTKQALHRRC
ncbi:hypothetical protein TNCV_3581381 [Trichonephila clavipes]|nr:hypothetical protein TNCV_3581381 [Trichonephila clavipes]